MAELIRWNDRDLSVPVEIALAVLEQIRKLAVDGMLSLRRVGVGIGGVLLGRYDRGVVTVLASREIACSHSFGPSFRLNREEAAAAARESGDEGLQVVGLYLSKPRGSEELDEVDVELFNTICRKSWQSILVVCPRSNDASTGAIYARGETGVLLGGARLPIQQTAEISDPGLSAPAGAEPPPFEPVPTPPVSQLAEAAIPRPEVRLFAPRRTVRPASLPPWLPWVAAVLILVAACGVAWGTRDRWISRPALELRSFGTGAQLTIEWNRRAVRGLNSGTLLVSDGGASLTIPLSQSQLRAGSFQYGRKSGKVSIVFRAGPVTEMTSYKDRPLSNLQAGPESPPQSHP